MSEGYWRGEGYEEAKVTQPARHIDHFVDLNRLVAPSEVTATFDFLPNVQPFSENEQLIFAEAFRETPKEFHKIAELLNGRSEKDCVEHYYATKWDRRFKTRSIRQLEAEKDDVARRLEQLISTQFVETSSGVPPRQMPLVEGLSSQKLDDAISLLEQQLAKRESLGKWDPETAPIEQEIARLNRLLQRTGKLYRKAYPPHSLPATVLPRPDLTILRHNFDEFSPFFLEDDLLVQWLRSGDVLPLLRSWYESCLQNAVTYIQLQRALPRRERPWPSQVLKIATYARDYGTRVVQLPGPDSTALLACARFAAQLATNNHAFFSRFKAYTFPTPERYAAAARVLLTAYDDLRQNAQGFFGTLLESELADLIKSSVRPAWERKYLFEGEHVELPKQTRKRDGAGSSAVPVTSIAVPDPGHMELPLYAPPADEEERRVRGPWWRGS